MPVGSAIKFVRKMKGISQGDLAEAASISAPYLCQIEGNKRTVTVETLETIAKVLEVPCFYLMLKGHDIEGVSEDKREAYRSLHPAVCGMLEGFFIGV